MPAHSAECVACTVRVNLRCLCNQEPPHFQDLGHTVWHPLRRILDYSASCCAGSVFPSGCISCKSLLSQLMVPLEQGQYQSFLLQQAARLMLGSDTPQLAHFRPTTVFVRLRKMLRLPTKWLKTDQGGMGCMQKSEHRCCRSSPCLERTKLRIALAWLMIFSPSRSPLNSSAIWLPDRWCVTRRGPPFVLQ